jgi:hypothetical protein
MTRRLNGNLFTEEEAFHCETFIYGEGVNAVIGVVELKDVSRRSRLINRISSVGFSQTDLVREISAIEVYALSTFLTVPVAGVFGAGRTSSTTTGAVSSSDPAGSSTRSIAGGASVSTTGAAGSNDILFAESFSRVINENSLRS